MDSHSPAASAPLEIRELQGSAHLRRQVQHDLALANSARAPRPRVRPAMRGIQHHDVQPAPLRRGSKTEMQLAPQLRPAEKLPPVRQASSAAPARGLCAEWTIAAPASASEPAPARKIVLIRITLRTSSSISNLSTNPTPLATSSRNEKGRPLGRPSHPEWYCPRKLALGVCSIFKGLRFAFWSEAFTLTMSSFCSAVHLASAACAFASHFSLAVAASAVGGGVRTLHDRQHSGERRCNSCRGGFTSPARPIQTTRTRHRYPARPALRSSFPAPRELAAAPRFRRILSCASQSVSAVRLPVAIAYETSPSSSQVLKPAQTGRISSACVASLADPS